MNFKKLHLLMDVLTSKPCGVLFCRFPALFWQWNAYFNAMMYLTQRALYPLQLVLKEILVQNQLSAMLEMDTDSALQQALLGETIKYAVIVVSSLPMLVIYPFIQKFFIKGVMIGAIKG